MAILNDSITKMRRFLRDPEGQIWSDDDLRNWFNETQLEIIQKTGILERVEAHYYPGQFTWSYTHYCEYEFVEGDSYQCLMENPASGMIISFPWEAVYWMELSDTPDDGYRITHPWEMAYVTAAEPLPVPLPHEFHKMKFAAFDEEAIFPLSPKEVAEQDRFYKTRTGRVTNYYRPDEEGNYLIPYPRPSTIVLQEYDYTETLSDTGGLVFYDEDNLQEKDTGLITDYIDTENAFFFVYEATPESLEDILQPINLPPWLIRVIEYGVLERAFGADTDGFIPSLRDYWKTRKDIGVSALQKYRRLRLSDRDFRMGRYNREPVSKHPTLGEHYPRQCP